MRVKSGENNKTNKKKLRIHFNINYNNASWQAMFFRKRAMDVGNRTCLHQYCFNNDWGFKGC